MASQMEVRGRMPSMEWEPKTLTFDQLKYARDAALYVLSTKTTEEAIRVFTEGLKPVLGVRSTSMDSSDDEDLEIDSSVSGACSGGGSGSGSSHRARSINRDVATAPF